MDAFAIRGVMKMMIFFYVFHQEECNFLLSDTNNRIDRKQGIAFDCTGSLDEKSVRKE